jgi:simple sugar transport system permease protein
MTENIARLRSALAAPLWPALGIALLILLNASIDAARGPGLFAQGAFLHISFADGVLGGDLIAILDRGAPIAILALGMSLVIATRGVDLSVGSIMAISGAVAAQTITSGHSSAVAIPLALGAGALCGLWNGLLVAGLKLQPFVATLILMVAGRGIAQLITDSQITTFHDPALECIGLGHPAWLPLPFPFLLACAMLIATLVIVRVSALGLLIEAVGTNPEAARLAGVRSRILIAGTYIFSGLCAAVAGLIAAANIKAADPFNAGQNQELAAIFAAVVGGASLLGGRFSLTGAAVGGLLMQTLITTMHARDISADVAPLPQALIILAIAIAASPRLREMLRRARRPNAAGDRA